MAINPHDHIRLEGYDDHTSAPHEHLPVVQNGEAIFRGHERAAYFVGLVALCGEEYLPEAYLAARQLRFQKYNTLGWLPNSAREADGGERDQDDSRSAQFAVVSNEKDGVVRVIATSRLILKDVEPVRPLPVEVHFPEAFTDRQITLRDTEASRMISDSKDRKERALATFACHRAMVGWGVANGYNRANAIAEEWLLDRFDVTNLPYEQLADYRPIDEYGGTRNTAIQIDPQQLIRKTRIGSLAVPLTTSLFFRGVRRNRGLGHYNSSFLWRY